MAIRVVRFGRWGKRLSVTVSACHSDRRSWAVSTLRPRASSPFPVAAGSEPVRVHDPLQELLRPRLARRAEHLLGRSLLEDDAVVEEAHARRDVAGEAHL